MLTNIVNNASNIVEDIEPSETRATFVSGSVKINNHNQAGLDPYKGFNLSNPINPNQTTTVSYDMLINTI
ncbi:hypothetical protein KU41_01855 [Clostridium botulinum]|nr:hypothetical protein KU41_01855 [Clostridium botulinum]